MHHLQSRHHMIRTTFKYWILLNSLFIYAQIGCAGTNPPAKTDGAIQSISDIILLNNQEQEIPFVSLDKKNFVYINLCKSADLNLLPILAKYDSISLVDLPLEEEGHHQAPQSNTIILSIDEPALDSATIYLIKQLSGTRPITLVAFAPFVLLKHFDDVSFPILWTDATDGQMAGKMASALFGGIAITSKLATDASPKYIAGSGYITEKTRLGYTSPKDEGINGEMLTAAVDKIVEEGINGRAYPGAVVLVAKNGNVVFEKAYGHHTYEKGQAMRVNDIFDMASITKIAATTLEVMRLTEQGKIDLEETMGHYLADARKSNKAKVKLRHVMLHEAGFVPFIPFYKSLSPTDTSRDSSANYPTKMADGIFIRKNFYKEVMWPQMLESPLNSAGKYVYSDLSMYVMKEVIEKVTKEPLNELVKKDFYRPLGMYNSGFQPRKYFAKNKIVPTENDLSFRRTLLQGYVHDQGAAMVDGVSGHAGLFSTANDLAIYAQMLLNKGKYGGKRYLETKTVDEFTSRYSSVSRRGLGFDRWDPDTTKHYPSKLASPATFGHTGYTGTCIWIDPSNQLTYIFLSNRVHPEVSNKLSQMNIRSRIEDAVYKAIQANAIK